MNNQTFKCKGIVGSEEAGYQTCNNTETKTIIIRGKTVQCCSECGRFYTINGVQVQENY